jgi:hypothetical protein
MPFSSHSKIHILFVLMVIAAIVSAFAISMASHDVSSKASGPAVTSFTGRHLTTTRVAQAPLSLHPPASHANAQVQTNSKLRVPMIPLLKKTSAATFILQLSNEIINDVTAFYTPNGTLVSSKIDLNTFFGEPVTLNVSDPRCYYDTPTQAWFFSVVVYTNSLVPNHTDLLVLNKQLQVAVYHI